MEIINCEQRTPEWFKARELCMTASNAQAIGNCGKGLDTYILKLVAEYLSTEEKEQITNEHIERGIELEDSARIAYELETGFDVDEVGFVKSGERIGVSPDGLVNEDGLVEIKCKSDENHLKQIVAGRKGIESSYMWQMQMQMLVTERDWCDFVCYNPNFEKSLLIYRIEADADMQVKLHEGFKIGKKKILETLEEYYKEDK